MRDLAALGAAVVWPVGAGCAKPPRAASPPHPVGKSDPLAIPRTRPTDWDPIAFNRARGNAGAIPSSYLPKINGPDGAVAHLGKHLPYVPSAVRAPAAMLALMFGDTAKGYAAHPNAAPSPALPTGHWFDWIRLRRAVDDDAEERESRFTGWPVSARDDNGKLAALLGDDPAQSDGKNTVYLVELPRDVRSGELLRVHASCRTHGEYVDFVQAPA
jgi:hypothetical protein